jgi:hypothetical protein
VLLCVVSKAERTISIYHTLARFGAAIAAELPERLSMRPEGRDGDFMGAYGHDSATGDYLLGPPIARLMVADLVDKESIQRFQTVLQAWVELDYENVIRELLSRPVDQDLLGSVFLTLPAGSLGEFSVGEGRAGADQGDEVGGVDGAPAVLR